MQNLPIRVNTSVNYNMMEISKPDKEWKSHIHALPKENLDFRDLKKETNFSKTDILLWY